MEIIIRDVKAEDATAIQSIYSHYVTDTVITFEEDVPPVEEMHSRIKTILDAGYPYIVACIGQQVVGYCYASTYRPRSGYRFTCESSVYLDHRKKGMGIGDGRSIIDVALMDDTGKKLMVELLCQLEKGRWRQVLASTIADNPASIALHESLGFVQVAMTPAVGWKLNRWVDTITLQKSLAGGRDTPPSISTCHE
ncbi:GCN5-like N-acetyltransferase [Planoprotostelium fungivorum]|uniref:GCN5-like N-acetyltransferase n=1 Tax=Planoprotostelium fungivorum TaxID=1890364 RepID=A0A2P6NPN1_9EUKA|nr:GCN5-like N-acetyltransferase [Planoprotostelium fungivorum]